MRILSWNVNGLRLSMENGFLDREYFEELENHKDIQNCVGRYKKIWDRQEGKCYI